MTNYQSCILLKMITVHTDRNVELSHVGDSSQLLQLFGATPQTLLFLSSLVCKSLKSYLNITNLSHIRKAFN